MPFVGFGMDRALIIPVERLRGGGMVVAEWAAEALWADSDVDHVAENRQVAQQAWLVGSMRLSDSAATAAASGTVQGAFNSQNELIGLGQVGLKDTHIGNIERN